MTFQEAIEVMRAGHAVRSEAWAPDMGHLYYRNLWGREEIRWCGDDLLSRTALIGGDDILATDWVVFRPGIGCLTCGSKG